MSIEYSRQSKYGNNDDIYELTLEKLADILKIVLSHEGSKRVTCTDEYGVTIILGHDDDPDDVLESYSIKI